MAKLEIFRLNPVAHFTLIHLKGWATDEQLGLDSDETNVKPPSLDLDICTHDQRIQAVDVPCDAFYPSLGALKSLSIRMDYEDLGSVDLDRILVASCCRQLPVLRYLRLASKKRLLYPLMQLIGSQDGTLMFPCLSRLNIHSFENRGFSVGHLVRIRRALTRRARRAALPLEVLLLGTDECSSNEWLEEDNREGLDELKELVGELRLLEPMRN